MSKIVIRKRGNKWEFRFEIAKISGKRKQFSKSGFISKKEAYAAGIKALSEYNNNGLIFTPPEISYSDLLDRWLSEYAKINCKVTTQEFYHHIIRKFLKPFLGNQRIKSLTPKLLQEFIYSLSGSYGYKTNIKTLLSSTLEYAIYPLGLLQNNPACFLKIPKEQKKERNRYIDLEIFSKIILLAKRPYVKIAVLLGYYCGMRLGEVFGLTWNNVDLIRNTITIEKTLSVLEGKKYHLGIPKTQTSNRTIAINKYLSRELYSFKLFQEENKKIYKNSYSYYNNAHGTLTLGGNKNLNLVIVRENGMMNMITFSKKILPTISKMINFKFTFHDLRHTAASDLVASGANIKYIQERLGHASVKTTLDIYAHVTNTMEKEAIEILEKLSCPPIPKIVDKKWTMSIKKDL
ncbi:MAG: site-specific integrase [Fusobacteriaceae bacterium]|jgi:integrase|nr:site-specific integrase [Fusobacteriaceae bacterium]